eukprot:GCRY01000417.1.p1 GENE.GCRY01000417.1~~GCRY01000417.1.p1  ORF type:complete len:370 (-),score=34.88 GCRY01000417.1:472-1509(-)
MEFVSSYVQNFSWNSVLDLFSSNSMKIVGGYGAISLLASVVKFLRRPGFKVKGKHVFITGGSTGLGKALAVECAKKGAHVSIISRNIQKLEDAAKEIKDNCVDSSQGVFYYSADVTLPDQVEEAVKAAVEKHGKIDVVFANAGVSHPDFFLDTPTHIYKDDMNLNYFGVVTTLKAVLPAMVAANEGVVGIVGSAMGVISFAGYSTYAPTKWALRGLGESLRNEFAHTNIKFHMFYPANIDTPLLHQENKTKPQVTHMIEGTAATYSAECGACSFIDGIAAGNYHVTNDPMIELCRWGITGMGPRSNFLLEFPFTPILAIAGWGYVKFMDFCVWYNGDKKPQKKSN